MLIDLTHPLDETTPGYPGDPVLSLAKIRTLERDGFTAYQINAGLHTGTHIDLPMHLTGDTRFARDFEPDCFAGPGLLLDVRGEDTITLKRHYIDAVPASGIVLLYTGHDKQYGTEEYFSSHPAISRELVDFFVEKRVKMLGMDMPSPDRPPYILHRALLSGGIFLLENLTNLCNVPLTAPFEVVALPLKLAAEASFVRAVCRIL
ncbi:MAG: cyclase family protein [Oscillospiraceae bacterium]|nr:cyclase family protein [Oscillospiraceae bacterium]